MNVRPWQAAKPCNCTTDRDAEIARMEAAPAAPESLRERVARAMWDAECQQPHNWDQASHFDRGDYYRLADAALKIITTPTEADQ
jgi:hypothetical protein